MVIHTPDYGADCAPIWHQPLNSLPHHQPGRRENRRDGLLDPSPAHTDILEIRLPKLTPYQTLRRWDYAKLLSKSATPGWGRPKQSKSLPISVPVSKQLLVVVFDTCCAGASGLLWGGSVVSAKKALHMQHFFACVHRQDVNNTLWSNRGTASHLLMIVARHRGGRSIGYLYGTLGLGESSACRLPFLD